MKRWILALVIVACSKKVEPPPPAPAVDAVEPVDPFDPRVECRNYVTRATPSLEGALAKVKSDDMTDAKVLKERALAMGTARGSLGVEPAVDAANKHYKASLKALDGLASGLSTLAASREPDAPANPELRFIAQKVIAYRTELESAVKALPTLCAPVK